MAETQKVRRSRRPVLTEIFDPADDTSPLPVKPHHSGEDRERLRALVRHTTYLSEIDKPRREAALDHFVKTPYKAGDTIYTAGEVGDNFYMIDSGKFGSYDESNNFLEKIKNCFGEPALLRKESRENTVKCEEDGVLWHIDRPLYTRIVITMAYERRCHQVDLLRSLDMLRLLERNECVRLSGALKYHSFDPGTDIYSPNEEALNVYFVLRGRVELRRDGETFKTIEQGGHFGELALLTHDRRDHHAVPLERTKCYGLQNVKYERLMSSLYRVLKEREPEEWKKIARKYFNSEEPKDVNFRLALPKDRRQAQDAAVVARQKAAGIEPRTAARTKPQPAAHKKSTSSQTEA